MLRYTLADRRNFPRGLRWPSIVALSLALAGSFVRLSEATVLVGADLGELAHEARAIARGRVRSVEPRWTVDHRAIETIVTIEVERYLKGAFGDTVQFRVPGGTLGRFRSIVVGAPTFTEDDYVVVFLGARGPSVPYVLGLSQGVFRLVPAESGRGWNVTPPPIGPSAITTPVVRGATTRVPVPLAQFERRVRALATGGVQ